MAEMTRIFTDGSAIGNPGPGGWGAVLVQDKKRWEISGSEPWTTIQEMELLAAVRALASLPVGATVELWSDSEYLIYGMGVLVFRWMNKGWRNRSGKELRDQGLWKQLLILNDRLFVQWRWIKGHNGHPEQTRADALAYQAARSAWIVKRAV